MLYIIVMSLNCLMTEKGTTANKRHFIVNTAGLIQDRCFENALTSKLKSKDMLLWRRGFAFVSTGNERLWIHSELRKIRFDQGRPSQKSLIVCMSSTSRTVSRLLTEMIKPHRIFQSELDCNSNFSLGPCKIISTPISRK